MTTKVYKFLYNFFSYKVGADPLCLLFNNYPNLFEREAYDSAKIQK